ncbi:MAG: tRNA (adenosine(37)-N6)-threonylcarbamoyltransferase complex dimerization subunit type 1 TsaB [Nitrosomonas sp.]|nr:tRNA (adenosine(37)-N6)-threonylcarbamoyltransferase complex dimerization subunit type 1 TsaB [Nitrosomonas sp.]
MKILAFETSTEYCSVALYLDGKLLNKDILAERCHSELLLPMVETILAEAKLTLPQVDGIAFGAGPGSFTGLRIACGVAQGLAFAADLPVIGVSTLEAVAQKNGEDKVVVALDARMGEIYHAAYQRSTDHWKTISAPTLCKPQHAPSISGSHWVGCGSGFDSYDKELSTLYNEQIDQINYGLYPHANEIALLAVPRFKDKSNTSPFNAAPIYIRNKVALKENER